MKKFYLLLMVLALGLTAQAGMMRAKGDVAYYDGTIDVVMQETQLAKDQEVRVSLTENADGSYTFELPDFVLADETGATIECGDIIVEGVTRVDADGDGIMEVAGSVADLSLAGGFIHAKVDLAGRELANGEMNLKIDVSWYAGYPSLDMIIPIYVTFDGKKNSGIGEVASDSAVCYGVAGAVAVDGYAGTVALYTLDGRMVAQSTVAGYTEIPAAKGIYLVRTGAKATKVIVK